MTEEITMCDHITSDAPTSSTIRMTSTHQADRKGKRSMLRNRTVPAAKRFLQTMFYSDAQGKRLIDEWTSKQRKRKSRMPSTSTLMETMRHMFNHSIMTSSLFRKYLRWWKATVVNLFRSASCLTIFSSVHVSYLLKDTSSQLTCATDEKMFSTQRFSLTESSSSQAVSSDTNVIFSVQL